MRITFWIKIMALVVALGGVLYSIKALKSPAFNKAAKDPNSVVGLLLGGDQRLYNWCPAEVEKVDIFQGGDVVVKTLNQPQDISAVCELMINAYTEGAQPPTFTRKLLAYPKGSGNPVSLEQVDGLPIFKAKDLAFSCPALEKILQRLSP